MPREEKRGCELLTCLEFFEARKEETRVFCFSCGGLVWIFLLGFCLGPSCFFQFLGGKLPFLFFQSLQLAFASSI